MEAIPSCQRLKPARFHPSSRPVQKRTAKTTSPTGQLIHKPKSKTTRWGSHSLSFKSAVTESMYMLITFT